MNLVPVEVVRIGVVGAGLVARTVHLPLLRELDDRFVVAGLAEPDTGVRERVGHRFAIAHRCGEHRELLDGVDALIVCSPNATHADIALDALDAGVHVLVEKPLALTVADADRIVAARDRTGLVVQVAYMKRFDPAYEALLDDLPPAGALRHVVTTTYDPGLAPYFGGAPLAPHTDVFSATFLGALVHDVNAVHGVLERLGVHVPLPVLDAAASDDGRIASGVVGLPGGARWFMAWMLLPGLGDFREQIDLYSDDGVRALTFPAPYALHSPTHYTATCGNGGGHQRTTFGSWDEPYRRQFVHFHECITEQRSCRTPPEQACADIELLTRLFEACA